MQVWAELMMQTLTKGQGGGGGAEKSWVDYTGIDARGQ